MSDYDKLNSRVAELQGWEEAKNVSGYPIWKNHNNIWLANYDPCNNWQQAGELLEKYKIELEYAVDTWAATFWISSSKISCPWTADNPRVAIVKAVIALLESD